MAEESDVDRLIGGNVQQFRNAKKMSQAQLADAMTALGLQVAQQTILKIEKGTRPLRYSEAVAVAEALDVPLSALAPDRVTARERQNIDMAALEAAEADALLSVAVFRYIEAAHELKTVLDESPNLENLYTPTELALMRWLAEGDRVEAIKAARAISIATAPEIPANPNPPF